MATEAGKDPSQDEEFLAQLYKGGELLAAGKVVEAKDHLERAFKLHPKNEKAQNLLGLTYFKLGLFDRASEIYELLVRENPADPTLRVNLGLVYLKTNNLPRAVKEFETSTDLEPTHKKAHNYLGLALAQSGDYARAREHFLIAGSDAMADKMARAVSAGATAPVAVTPSAPPSAPGPHPVSAAFSGPPPLPVDMAPVEEIAVESLGPPPLPHDDASIEVMTEDVIEDDSGEIVPAESLLKPKANPNAVPLPGRSNGSSPSSAANALAEAAQELGGASKPPLPSAGYEDVPVPTPSSPTKSLLNDWGAQFGMDEAPHGQPRAAPEAAPEDDMRFAEDEGPSAMPMQSAGGATEAVATSEAAVATGAQVPVEVVERAQGSESWESGEQMQMAEQAEGSGSWESAEPQQAEQQAQSSESWDGADPMQAQAEGSESWGAVEPMPMVEPTAEEMMVDVDPAAGFEASTDDVALGATSEQAEIPPGMHYASEGQQPSDDVPLADALDAGGEGQAAGGDGSASYSAESYAPADDVPLADAIDQAPANDGQSVEMFPSGGGDEGYAQQEGWPTSDGAPPEAASPGWLTGGAAAASQAAEQSQVPLTAQVPTGVIDMAMPQAQSSGYSPMVAPRLEELGPSQALSFTPGELNGPFNLSSDGLALSVNGELLSRMPHLMAVVGTIDATPEHKRSRGRTTDQPFGQGENQLQRVRGNGLVHLDPKGSVYQAIDLADEGAYIREERVFAFEEAVAFENARLTGQGSISVDVVHLKGQGKVLLKLEGALKAMAIPPGTPLKVPLSRLVGWYGYVSVRVMGFVGQGAVELTGDGYVLLAA